MPGPQHTRASDERTLSMVAARSKGETVVAIAERFGVSPTRVGQLTDPVKRDDLIYSREPPLLVLRHYWQGRNRK